MRWAQMGERSCNNSFGDTKCTLLFLSFVGRTPGDILMGDYFSLPGHDSSRLFLQNVQYFRVPAQNQVNSDVLDNRTCWAGVVLEPSPTTICSA